MGEAHGKGKMGRRMEEQKDRMNRAEKGKKVRRKEGRMKTGLGENERRTEMKRKKYIRRE